MTRYVTTNIRLEADVLKQIRLRAVHEGKRMAEVVREAVHSYLSRFKESVAKKKTEKDPIWKIVGMCSTGRKYDSEDHDAILYGKKVYRG